MEKSLKIVQVRTGANVLWIHNCKRDFSTSNSTSIYKHMRCAHTAFSSILERFDLISHILLATDRISHYGFYRVCMCVCVCPRWPQKLIFPSCQRKRERCNRRRQLQKCTTHVRWSHWYRCSNEPALRSLIALWIMGIYLIRVCFINLHQHNVRVGMCEWFYVVFVSKQHLLMHRYTDVNNWNFIEQFITSNDSQVKENVWERERERESDELNELKWIQAE